MSLSKRCEYGLRALIDLGIARELGIALVPLTALSAEERMPESFLEQILIRLREAGLVSARRGKRGGYALARPAGGIRMGDAVRVLEGPLAPIACVSVTAYRRCSCPDEAHCGLRLLMLDVRSAISSVLDRHTLADVVELTLRRYRRDGVEPPFFRSRGGERWGRRAAARGRSS